jgi:enolase
MSTITDVKGRMVLDSLGRPTVEADAWLDDGTIGRAIVSSGTNWEPIVSARSGETEDVFTSHLAMGTDSGWLKVGSIQKSDRTAGWNEFLRIAEMLGDRSRMPRPRIS